MWQVNQTRNHTDQAMGTDGSTCGIPYIFGISAAGAICLVYVYMECLLCTPTCIALPSILVSKKQVIPDSALGRITLGRYYRSPSCSTIYQQGFPLPEIPSLLSSQPLKVQTKRGGRPTRAHNLLRSYVAQRPGSPVVHLGTTVASR